MKDKNIATRMVVMILVGCVGMIQAEVIEIGASDDSSLADNYLQDGTADLVLYDWANNMAVGDLPDNRQSAAVAVYALPILNAGEMIGAATWDAHLYENLGVVSNADVEVFFKDTAAVELSDYNTSGVASLADFVTSSSVVGTYEWSNSDLVNALNSVYSGGATPSSQYVVFRIKMQGDNVSNGDGVKDKYSFYTKEFSIPGNRPTLTLTTVPEPMTIGLFSIN